MEDGGAPDLVGVLPFVFLDRQRAYGCPHGVCPRPDHGWATREDMGTAGPTSKFRDIYWTGTGYDDRDFRLHCVCLCVCVEPRLISGVHYDEFGACYWLRCKLCWKEREELNQELADLIRSYVLLPAQKRRKVARLEAAIDARQFWVRAYDEEVVPIMAEKLLPFTTANTSFIVRTATSRSPTSRK